MNISIPKLQDIVAKLQIAVIAVKGGIELLTVYAVEYAQGQIMRMPWDLCLNSDLNEVRENLMSQWFALIGDEEQASLEAELTQLEVALAKAEAILAMRLSSQREEESENFAVKALRRTRRVRESDPRKEMEALARKYLKDPYGVRGFEALKKARKLPEDLKKEFKKLTGLK